MLLATVVALDVSCLVFLLHLQAEKAEGRIAARHHLRQIDIHIVLHITVLTIAAQSSFHNSRASDAKLLRLT